MLYFYLEFLEKTLQGCFCAEMWLLLCHCYCTIIWLPPCFSAFRPQIRKHVMNDSDSGQGLNMPFVYLHFFLVSNFLEILWSLSCTSAHSMNPQCTVFTSHCQFQCVSILHDADLSVQSGQPFNLKGKKNLLCLKKQKRCSWPQTKRRKTITYKHFEDTCLAVKKSVLLIFLSRLKRVRRTSPGTSASSPTSSSSTSSTSESSAEWRPLTLHAGNLIVVVTPLALILLAMPICREANRIPVSKH